MALERPWRLAMAQWRWTHPRWIMAPYGTVHGPIPRYPPQQGPRTSFDLRTRSNKRPGQQRRDLEKASTLTTVNYETSWDYQENFSIAIPKVQVRLRASWWLSGLMLFIYVYFVGHISLDTRHDRFSNNRLITVRCRIVYFFTGIGACRMCETHPWNHGLSRFGEGKIHKLYSKKPKQMSTSTWSRSRDFTYFLSAPQNSTLDPNMAWANVKKNSLDTFCFG